MKSSLTALQAETPMPAAPILLVKLRGIGDSVLSLPSLGALQRLFPGAPIDVLVPSASLGVFSAERRVRRVMAYPRGSLRAQIAQLFELRQQGYGLVFCPHASLRSAIIAVVSGAPRRSVRNHSGRDWFSNVACVTPKEPKSIVEREFDPLRALGWRGNPPPIRMALGATGKAWAKAWCKRQPRLRQAILIAPGGSVPERRWPLERFVDLSRRLLKQGRSVIWLQAPGEAEAPALKGLLQAQPPDVQALGALSAEIGLLLGNNSGPRHVAAACGARTLTLFASDLPREWHPYSMASGHRYLRPENGRLDTLGVPAVLAALKALSLAHPKGRT